MSKHRKVRASSRWMSSPRNTPCQPQTHLSEREQLNRRIRRCLLPAEPSAAVSFTTPRSSDVLRNLRTYYDALRRDEDCYAAWIGLSQVFAALEDHERVRSCRDVALRLQSSSTEAAPLPN